MASSYRWDRSLQHSGESGELLYNFLLESRYVNAFMYVLCYTQVARIYPLKNFTA